MIAKEKIEAEYKNFTNGLEHVLDEFIAVEGENEELKKIQHRLWDVIYQRYNIIQKESKATIESTVWDKLVIAFFGETNAGKSTIIESFRIKFNELGREQSLKDNGHYEDGLIVGDGSPDYTKHCVEYNLSINNRPFTLIDVPGIEGNEDEYRDEIKKALDKAHIVFYVQGHNKQPDTATAEKIKKYLKDWVNVYSIYNVRGGISNYDEPDERETLATEYVICTEMLISEVFRQTLGDNYKGNITVQGLLNLCSLANFSEKRKDLIRTQNKLVKYFSDRETIYNFARFEDIVNIVDDKSINFIAEIIEANKQKMTFLAYESYSAIENEFKKQSENIDKLRNTLCQFNKDVDGIFRMGKINIDRDMKYAINAAFTEFKSQIFAIIDTDGDKLPNAVVAHCVNLDKKTRTQLVIDHLEEQLSKSIEDKVKRSLTNNLKSIKDRIATKRRSLDSFMFNFNADDSVSISAPSINSSDFLSELDLKLSDIASFACDVASGALIGSAFTLLMPGLATAIGAVLGGVLHVAKKMFFGDHGKAKAKEEAAKQIEEAKNSAIKSTQQMLQEIKDQLSHEKEAIHNSINYEIERLDKTEAVLKVGQKKISKFITNIKNKEYGII